MRHEPHSICADVCIQDEVFVGHGVMFINDKCPRATSESADACGTRRIAWFGYRHPRRVRIGRGALVGAGAVVIRDLGSGEVVVGNPARILPEDVGWLLMTPPAGRQVPRREFIVTAMNA